MPTISEKIIPVDIEDEMKGSLHQFTRCRHRAQQYVKG